MRHWNRLWSLPLLLAVTGTAHAQDATAGERLIEAARCDACHQREQASLGPPWQAIAARHAANRDVMVDVLASKIVRGGGGNWGNVPMVPNQWVSAEEARAMAVWVLNLSNPR